MQSSFGALRWLHGYVCLFPPVPPASLLSSLPIKYWKQFAPVSCLKKIRISLRSQLSVECHVLDIASFAVLELNNTLCWNSENTDTRFEFSVSSLLIQTLLQWSESACEKLMGEFGSSWKYLGCSCFYSIVIPCHSQATFPQKSV